MSAFENRKFLMGFYGILQIRNINRTYKFQVNFFKIVCGFLREFFMKNRMHV